MGYNYHCNSQTCSLNCCNINGNCPSVSSSCVYYYSANDYGPNGKPSNSGEMALAIGAPLGACFGFFLLVTIIVCVCKRRLQTQQQQLRAQQIIHQNPHLNTTESNLMMNNNSFGKGFNQPTIVTNNAFNANNGYSPSPYMGGFNQPMPIQPYIQPQPMYQPQSFGFGGGFSQQGPVIV